MYGLLLEDGSEFRLEDGSALWSETLAAMGTCPTSLVSVFTTAGWPDPARAKLSVL